MQIESQLISRIGALDIETAFHLLLLSIILISYAFFLNFFINYDTHNAIGSLIYGFISYQFVLFIFKKTCPSEFTDENKD